MESKPFLVEQKGWPGGESLALVFRDSQVYSTLEFLCDLGKVALLFGASVLSI